MDDKDIESRLGDRVSFDIYHNLKIWTERNDWNRLTSIYRTAFRMQRKKYLNFEGERYFFGAGVNGMRWMTLLHIPITAYVDNDVSKHGANIIGKPVIGLHMAKASGMYFITTENENAKNKIQQQLIEHGVNKENIIILKNPMDNLADRYFQLNELNLSENENFIDIGAGWGDTAVAFLHAVRWRFNHIYIYEPSPRNFSEIVKLFPEEKFRNINMINRAVWNVDGMLNFCERGSKDELSFVSSVGNIKVNGCKLADEFTSEDVSFIKIHVNGDELKVLEGAQGLISEQEPKIAISIDIRNGQWIDVMRLLFLENPKYYFFFRCYCMNINGLVLYAL